MIVSRSTTLLIQFQIALLSFMIHFFFSVCTVHVCLFNLIADLLLVRLKTEKWQILKKLWPYQQVAPIKLKRQLLEKTLFMLKLKLFEGVEGEKHYDLFLSCLSVCL
jgi:hypothetical protein